MFRREWEVLYKYLFLDQMEKIDFDEDFFTVKFTDLAQYNDPYEQSLVVDLADIDSCNAEYDQYLRSMYKEKIDKCKGYLATCFSKRPDVIPMWAHYAKEQEGIIIGIDEKLLKDYLIETLDPEERKNFYINDISYQSDINPEFKSDFEGSVQRGKGIHSVIADNYFFKAFYFHKQACWQYEQERRLGAVEH